MNASFEQQCYGCVIIAGILIGGYLAGDLITALIRQLFVGTVYIGLTTVIAILITCAMGGINTFRGTYIPAYITDVFTFIGAWLLTAFVLDVIFK